MIPIEILFVVAGLAGSGTPAPWRPLHEELVGRLKPLAADLEAARQALLARARGDAAATARLAPQPVRLRPAGYGVLPEIVADAEPTEVQPTEKRYALERLATDVSRALDDGARLARRAPRARVPLSGLIDALDALEKRLLNLEEHLGYHAYWQEAVVDYPEFFEQGNAIIVEVREIEASRRRAGEAVDLAARRRELLERLAPFVPTPGLALEIRADGFRVLPVTVTTDIEDEAFVAAFRDGVEAAFVRSAAARELRFRLELRLEPIDPAKLYPEGPPPHGSRIDPQEHLARFPPAALVLTTGEESTNARTGRSIVLGPADISRRTLAHEFAHLLGFRDAYLRGFDRASDERFGVVLVEWTGLRDDLMGDTEGGRVTPEMIRTLIAAYGPR